MIKFLRRKSLWMCSASQQNITIDTTRLSTTVFALYLDITIRQISKNGAHLQVNCLAKVFVFKCSHFGYFIKKWEFLAICFTPFKHKNKFCPMGQILKS